MYSLKTLLNGKGLWEFSPPRTASKGGNEQNFVELSTPGLEVEKGDEKYQYIPRNGVGCGNTNKGKKAESPWSAAETPRSTIL